jgi:8-oxo-dGTP pyrophosphatase MutT (NUDIX family)
MTERQQPTPAATVVPLRDGPAGLEVLMLRRAARGAFGGMWVFPGGQVEPEDHQGPVGGSASEREQWAARRAAIREASEEAGLAIAEPDLVTLSFWVPQADAPRRFATWFFLARVTDARVIIDGAEVHEHRWLQPASAMAERDAGRMELVAPTFMTLWWLSERPNVAMALTDAAGREPERYHTHIVSGLGGLSVAVWQGDAGYDDSDVDRPGPRRRLWLDPAGWRVEVTGPGSPD